MRKCSATIEGLRNAALKRKTWPGIATLPLIDAAAWQEGRPDEDWLAWRARRVARRLENIPIEISPGELVVGRPEFRPATEEEARRIKEAQETVLRGIPPFPGGDAGHFHPDYETIFRIGISGIRKDIATRKSRESDPGKRAFYDACAIAMGGLSTYAVRVAEACEAAADRADADAAANLRAQAGSCRRLASAPPATFHEAVQLMFLVIVALWFGEDHGLTSPGRMDQTLRRFYEADLAAGRLTPDRAFDLICGLYIQFNMICAPGLAVAVMVGGRDRNGKDATCELTYLCLEARLATHLVYPTVGLAWHEGTPPELMDFACRMLATGIGCPAFFNDELIAAGLRDNGVAETDCHNYVNATCVEIKVAGASNIWVTAPYFNCPQMLLDVLDSAAAGTLPWPATFAELQGRVRDRISAIVAGTARQMDDVWRRRAETGGFPLASCFVADCVERGQDYDRGGARYNWVENSFVGLANLVDGLLAIKRLVYESGELPLDQFHAILKADFSGEESLRRRLVRKLPHYGTDDDEADSLAVEWTDFLSRTSTSLTVGPHAYVPGFFCWVMHAALGSQTGATPDGRRAGAPLADGAGAAQGRETAGPTASILSTTKWSHRAALGGLVQNLRLAEDVLRTDTGQAALRGLVQTYLRRGGFEIQVNVVGADVLRDAREHPERHADLIVRVAGYSDYFTHLPPNMQDEIISRTEHGTM